MEVVRFQRCGARDEIHVDGVGRQNGGPEETVLSDPRIEVVNLCAP